MLEQMQRLAAKKLPGAQYDLGYRYLHGIGVPKDTWKAIDFLGEADKVRHAGAKKVLGDMARARGNYVFALSCYTKAFERGYVLAGVEARRMYTVHAPDSAKRKIWADRVREKGEPRPGWRASELAKLGR